MQITRLREETESDHRAVEGSLSLMSDTLGRAEYLAALERMYGVVSAWECFAETAAPPELLPVIHARSRRSLLEADIVGLGGCIPVASVTLPELTSQSELLGALYVMEGSRLGGQFIARHVEAVLGLEAGFGTAYFRGFGETTGSNWKQLLSIIESTIPESDAAITVAAAKKMFRTFGAWMTNVTRGPRHTALQQIGESLDG